MFTGLIVAVGTLEAIRSNRAYFYCPSDGSHPILEDLEIGDSICVDGACLTVEEYSDNGFVAAVSPETLDRSTLGNAIGRSVNLEPSLRVGSKLGGHFVTGHVDGVGCLQAVETIASSWRLRFGPVLERSPLWESQIAPYLVPKGSIAVNGVSLTIAECDGQGEWFEAAVIPHSYDRTNLKTLQPGSWVNLEADLLGKYVARFLGNRVENNGNGNAITPEFLAEHGWL